MITGATRAARNPFAETGMSKLRILAEFWAFLRERKLWWMAPIIIVLLLLGLLIVLTEGSAIAPFIYTFF